jgi:hypothetical protein
LTLFVKEIARIGAAIVTRIGILASGPPVLGKLSAKSSSLNSLRINAESSQSDVMART